MYGSYGSYSSMSAMSAPMDITASNLRTHDDSCAFPSWPRRSSLSSSSDEERPTSFLSDDDLFLSDPFEEDVHSESSSSTTSPQLSPNYQQPQHQVPHHLLPLAMQNEVTEANLLAMERERERIAMQREFVRQVINEKERRRQAMRRYRGHSSSGSAKKSPKSKLSSMTPIAEA